MTNGKVLLLHATVRLAGQVITGATLSILVIVCTQVDELPQLSDAVQVRVMIESQAVPDLASAKVIFILV